MKKHVIIWITFFLAITALSSAYASTTCTLIIAGTEDPGYTYEVQFMIYDAWYSTPYTGWSSWTSCNVGTTNNFPIPHSVVPDCDNRWVVIAYGRQLYYGTPTGYTDYDNTSALSSDEYNAGNFTLRLTFP